MSTSSFAQAYTYLLTNFPAAVQAVDSNAVVYDAWAVSYADTSVVLGQSSQSAVGGEIARDYHQLGAQKVEEIYSIPCYVVVFAGGSDISGMRAKALAVTDAIHGLIAQDLTLGGALNSGWAGITSVTIAQGDNTAEGNSNGRVVSVDLLIQARNVYRPGA